jgi:hypothetical protein
LQGPPKFTQIWIFGLKTTNMATLVPCRRKLSTAKIIKSCESFAPWSKSGVAKIGLRLESRVARWFVFKQKIPVW